MLTDTEKLLKRYNNRHNEIDAPETERKWFKWHFTDDKHVFTLAKLWENVHRVYEKCLN